MVNLFPERLNERLKEMSLRATDLHKTLGFAHSTISNWKKGRVPHGSTLKTLAEKLGVAPEWLIGQTDDPARHEPMLSAGADPPRASTHATKSRDAQTRSLEEALADYGPEHCALIMNGTLESMKGNPLHVRQSLEFLSRVADYLISQDPALLAQAQWLAAFDDKHLSSTHPESEPTHVSDDLPVSE